MKKPKDQDVHTQMIEYFIEYSHFNNRFMLYGYKENSMKAKSALTKISQLAKKRKKEITDDLKALYNGEETSLTGASKFVKQRLERKNQKQKANKDPDNT
jgi:isopropylmalate/homocitrate/citramalate synthase